MDIGKNGAKGRRVFTEYHLVLGKLVKYRFVLKYTQDSFKNQVW
jgi:hypothetical protein